MGRFWSPKSTQDGPSWAPDGSWNDNYWKKWISTKSFKTIIKSIQMTPRAVTKQPKIVHKRCQDDLAEVFFSVRFLHWFLFDFWSDFGPLWDPFWRPFGGPNRAFLVSIFRSFLHVVLRGSKRAPRGPKRCPRGPKRPPRGAQEAPRGPQERPRAAKNSKTHICFNDINDVYWFLIFFGESVQSIDLLTKQLNNPAKCFG